MTGRFTASWKAKGRPTGLFSLAALAVVLAIEASIVWPVIAREGWRDWWAYRNAGERLVAHLPLYGGSDSTGLLLYPPAMAGIWQAGFRYEALLFLDLVALVAIGWLAFGTARASGVPHATAVAAGTAVVGLALLSPAVFHDALLGNVMIVYAGAIALSLAVPGLRGAIPLGVVIAVAAKPFIVPYLVYLLIARRRDGLLVAGVAAGATLVAVATVGLSPHVEYAQAIPTFASQARSYAGNLGVSAFAPALVGIVAIGAVALSVVVSRRGDSMRAAAAAIALGLFVQPSLGMIYAVVLIPALIVLWPWERLWSTTIALVGPVAALVSPLIPASLVGLAAARPLIAHAIARVTPGTGAEGSGRVHDADTTTGRPTDRAQ